MGLARASDVSADGDVSANEDVSAGGTDRVLVSDSDPTLASDRLAEKGLGTRHDPERADDASGEKATGPLKEPNLVSWSGPDDRENPKNWNRRQKWSATFIVASFTFISPVSSSIVAPALSQISAALSISSEVQQALVFSMFVLGYAIGPLFLGPLSEIYGRVPVLQLANLFYLIFNSVAGWSRNIEEMIAFRFLSGLGGSAPLAIGGGVLGDIWSPEERGAALSIYSLAPLIGPAVGPIVGGFIAEYTTWRWVFWAPSIADIFVQLLGLVYLQETYAPKLLQAKVTKLRQETGNDQLRTEYDRPDRSFASIMSRSLARPFVLLGTQPIVQILALYMAYLYGTYYLVLSTFPMVWEQRYGESIGIAGLNYLSIALGPWLGAQTAAIFNNRIYRSLKKRHNNIGRPEYRVPIMIPGSFLVPIGLFWYGWSAQAHTHWIVPNLGVCLFSMGGIFGFQGIQVYLVDTYTTYAASALAAAGVLRNILAFAFPLFAASLYERLDLGWGNSLLAFIALAIGIPAPLLLWKYGQLLREKSPYVTDAT